MKITIPDRSDVPLFVAVIERCRLLGAMVSTWAADRTVTITLSLDAPKESRADILAAVALLDHMMASKAKTVVKCALCDAPAVTANPPFCEEHRGECKKCSGRCGNTHGDACTWKEPPEEIRTSRCLELMRLMLVSLGALAPWSPHGALTDQHVVLACEKWLKGNGAKDVLVRDARAVLGLGDSAGFVKQASGVITRLVKYLVGKGAVEADFQSVNMLAIDRDPPIPDDDMWYQWAREAIFMLLGKLEA